jgi:hypothetical protein
MRSCACLAGLLVMTSCIGTNEAVPVAKDASQPAGKTYIVFDIRQNLDVIRHSLIGAPPQFAIWLEDPDTRQLRTVFVTRSSAKGKWVGKTRCPVALPRWFDVFKEEFESADLPNYKNPLPDALSGATPKSETFSVEVEVEPGSRWVCWIEMNLAGDFNDVYRPRDDERKIIDIHLSGQPPLLYTAEISAVPGEQATPRLVAQSALDGRGKAELQAVGRGVTTAKDVFSRVEIGVVVMTPVD